MSSWLARRRTRNTNWKNPNEASFDVKFLTATLCERGTQIVTWIETGSWTTFDTVRLSQFFLCWWRSRLQRTRRPTFEFDQLGCSTRRSLKNSELVFLNMFSELEREVASRAHLRALNVFWHSNTGVSSTGFNVTGFANGGGPRVLYQD